MAVKSPLKMAVPMHVKNKFADDESGLTLIPVLILAGIVFPILLITYSLGQSWRTEQRVLKDDGFNRAAINLTGLFNRTLAIAAANAGEINACSGSNTSRSCMSAPGTYTFGTGTNALQQKLLSAGVLCASQPNPNQFCIDSLSTSNTTITVTGLFGSSVRGSVIRYRGKAALNVTGGNVVLGAINSTGCSKEPNGSDPNVKISGNTTINGDIVSYCDGDIVLPGNTSYCNISGNNDIGIGATAGVMNFQGSGYNFSGCIRSTRESLSILASFSGLTSQGSSTSLGTYSALQSAISNSSLCSLSASSLNCGSSSNPRLFSLTNTDPQGYRFASGSNITVSSGTLVINSCSDLKSTGNGLISTSGSGRVIITAFNLATNQPCSNTIDIRGDSGARISIIAPLSKVILGGNGSLSGLVLGRTVEMDGSSSLTYSLNSSDLDVLRMIFNELPGESISVNGFASSYAMNGVTSLSLF